MGHGKPELKSSPPLVSLSLFLDSTGSTKVYGLGPPRGLTLERGPGGNAWEGGQEEAEGLSPSHTSSNVIFPFWMAEAIW